jgi:hypothetical protein
MEMIPPNQDDSITNFTGPSSEVTERVRARARELALLAGRPLGHVTPIDFEQAKREVLETPAPTRKSRAGFWAPSDEPARWKPAPARTRRSVSS